MNENTNNCEVQETVAAMTEAEADELRTRVRKLAADINLDTFDLGETLWRIARAPEHLQRWGHSSIAGLAEAEGLGGRKGEYLVGIYEWFMVTHPLPDILAARVRKIPWTKLRHLVGLVTAEDAIKWISAAESLSRDELCRKVAAERANPSIAGQQSDDQAQEGAAEVFRQIRFTLADSKDGNDPSSQFATVRGALKRAAQLSGRREDDPPKDGHLLTTICTDFLATNDFGTSSGEARLHYLAKIETLLGLPLVVINPDCTQVLHGMDTLARLSRASNDATEESEDPTKKEERP